MDINLTIVEDGGKYTAHATISPVETGKKKSSIVVLFSVNGKAKKPVVAEGAMATLELGELKVGTYKVKAKIAGTNPAVETEEDVEIKDKPPKKKNPAGILEWVLMILFWMLVWVTGPGWLTVLYLGLTLGVLWLIAKIADTDEVTFWSLLLDNNWVFPAVVGMALVSWFMSYMNPLTPQTPVEWLKGLLTGTPKTFGGHAVWAFFNKIYFGKAATRGWSHAAVTYVLWIVPAIIVSYWDEVAEKWKKMKMEHKGDSEGLLKLLVKFGKFLLKDGIAEIFWSKVGLNK